MKAELAHAEEEAQHARQVAEVEPTARQMVNSVLASVVSKSASVDEDAVQSAAVNALGDVEAAMESVKFRSVLAAARRGTMAMALREVAG